MEPEETKALDQAIQQFLSLPDTPPTDLKFKIETLEQVRALKDRDDYIEWLKKIDGRGKKEFLNLIDQCVNIWLNKAPIIQEDPFFGPISKWLGFNITTPQKEAVDKALGGLVGEFQQKLGRLGRSADSDAKRAAEAGDRDRPVHPQAQATVTPSSSVEAGTGNIQDVKRQAESNVAVVGESAAEVTRRLEAAHAAEIARIKAEHAQELARKDQIIQERDRKIVDLQNDISKLQNTLKTLTADMGKLKDDLKLAQDDVKPKDQRIAELDQRIVTLEKTLKTAQDLNQSLGSRAALAQDAQRDAERGAREDAKRFQEEIDKLKAELEAAKKAHADILAHATQRRR